MGHSMGLSCGGKCGMAILIIFNVLFLLAGLGIMIIGILMKVNIDVLDDEEVVTLLNKVSVNSLGLGNIVQSLSTYVICLGVFIVVVSFLGAVGACCKQKCLLVTYAIIVILLLIAQITALALWATMKDKVDNKLTSELKDQLKSYNGVTATDDVSKGWNILFIGFECCGVRGITSSNDEFAESTWATTRGSKKIPYSCCNSATADNYQTGTETSCTDNLNNYRETGCYDKFNDWIEKYQTWAIVCSVLLIVFEIVLVIFAFVLCREAGREGMVV